MKNKVWFVTGASKGLGLSLVKQLLEQGYRVAATSRKQADLEKAVGAHDNFLALATDLTNEESVHAAVAATVAKFGTVDVVVNNAGYGLSGGVEEITDAEVRENFNVNVFGSLNVIRQSMPYLRAQGSGHIFNISSIGGFTGSFPGWGIYCATKFAVHGFTESLAIEAKDFGINVTVVSPGYFRTNFLESDSMVIAKNQMAAYQAVRDSQALHQHSINGNQPGDPEKAVAAMIDVTNAQNPPLHLFLGSDAYAMVNTKLDAVKKELEAWKGVTTGTDFATAPASA